MTNQFPPKGDADKRIGAHTSPLTVSPQELPNMTVKIKAGSFLNGNNQLIEYSGGNTPIITVTSGNPKWVVVGINNSGLITITHGTAAPAPSIPAVQTTVLPLAAIYVAPTTTAITDPMIVDIRPFLRLTEVVPNLVSELASRPTETDLSNAIATKADATGTPSATFMLNSDVITGSPSSDAVISVSRGSSPAVSIRWNESVDAWEFTNNGTQYFSLSGVSSSDLSTKANASVQVLASTGLVGGGDLSTNRTLSVASRKLSGYSLIVPAITTGSEHTVAVSMSGVVPGDTVSLGLVPVAGFTYDGYISAPNTITFRVININGAIVSGAANCTITAICFTSSAF